MTQPLGNCPGCGGDEVFEQVHPGQHAGDPCPDSGGECLEWVCTGCGTGLFLGIVITGPRTGDEEPAVPARQSARAA
jgi:hypothetical protein